LKLSAWYSDFLSLVALFTDPLYFSLHVQFIHDCMFFAERLQISLIKLETKIQTN